MIVKVQLSLADSDGQRRVLVYDEPRELEYETADALVVEAVEGLLAGEAKGFFHASLDERSRFGLGLPAPDQSW